jgi:hypothetical protein
VVPPRQIPQEVAHGLQALLPEHLHEAGDALPLYTFEGL